MYKFRPYQTARETVSIGNNLATERTIFRSLNKGRPPRVTQQTHHLHLQGEQYYDQHLSLKHSTPLKQESRVTGFTTTRQQLPQARRSQTDPGQVRREEGGVLSRNNISFTNKNRHLTRLCFGPSSSSINWKEITEFSEAKLPGEDIW